MSYDAPSVYSTNVRPRGDEDAGSLARIQETLREFIYAYFTENKFKYRDQLQQNVRIKNYSLSVDLEDVLNVNNELGQKLVNEPAEHLAIFERAAREVARKLLNIASKVEKKEISDIPPIQIILKSNASPTAIRNLNADHISKLVRIPGIIIGASTLSSKANTLQLVCKNCKHTHRLEVGGGFSKINMPKVCLGEGLGDDAPKCPSDPYVIAHDKSSFYDQQTLKLQEAPDMVPVGEMPRHILLAADRYLTNRVIPGTRCTVVGIYSIYQSKVKTTSAVAIRNPYIRVVGIHTEIEHDSQSHAVFTEEEEEEFLKLSRTPDLFEKFAGSIAPSIYGNKDIKKAIACLLMGGSKRILPDNMRLRGDINVLMLGDPGTAKSQLLKFVEKVSPIAIYTSGKGSSAAGLTASVQRDTSSREFYLEGGAMVLADGGVVCIDEFDKMRDEDRVAIHEAMEQQTISIAKAGITTILNSRTSVLAAANPIFGRYDDMKSAGENIDFQTTILSRFDMIFLVKDEHNEARDQTIARHVMNIHMNRSNQTEVVGEIPIEVMKRYVSYCRAKCAPRLSEEAAEKLASNFVEIRRKVHQKEARSGERSSIPITVRQLEAIIRITESIAKLHLQPIATEEHVDEALRLFFASTMSAVGEEGDNRDEMIRRVNKLEGDLKRRLPIGWSTAYQTLVREYVNNGEYSKHELDKTLMVMERRETVQFRSQRSKVYRCAV